jgi:hypothetical protein
VARRLSSGRWDFVVLQEQAQRPSFDPRHREPMMYQPARALHTLIDSAGAQTVFYLTFARRAGDRQNRPDDTYEAMQRRVIDGYTSVARELGARVAPVGVIWQEALRQRPALPLWARDGMHPSRLGSYLVACVLYAALYGDSPLGNSYLGGLDEKRARYLQSLVAAYFDRNPAALRPPGRVRVPVTRVEPDEASGQASGARRKNGRPGILLPAGGKCAPGYLRVRGVCYHRSLPRDRAKRDRIIRRYRRGVVPPLVD